MEVEGSGVLYLRRGEWDHGERPRQNHLVDHTGRIGIVPGLVTFLRSALVLDFCDTGWLAPSDSGTD